MCKNFPRRGQRHENSVREEIFCNMRKFITVAEDERGWIRGRWWRSCIITYVRSSGSLFPTIYLSTWSLGTLCQQPISQIYMYVCVSVWYVCFSQNFVLSYPQSCPISRWNTHSAHLLGSCGENAIIKYFKHKSEPHKRTFLPDIKGVSKGLFLLFSIALLKKNIKTSYFFF